MKRWIVNLAYLYGPLELRRTLRLARAYGAGTTVQFRVVVQHFRIALGL